MVVVHDLGQELLIVGSGIEVEGVGHGGRTRSPRRDQLGHVIVKRRSNGNSSKSELRFAVRTRTVAQLSSDDDLFSRSDAAALTPYQASADHRRPTVECR